MQLSETHLKHIIKKELRSLLEQEKKGSALPSEKPLDPIKLVTDKMDDMEAIMRINHMMRYPISKIPSHNDPWYDKNALKILWKQLFSIGRAEWTRGPINVSWDAISRMIDPPWDPHDPPHWIPPVSKEVCLKIKEKLSTKGETTFDEKVYCYPGKPVNVNNAPSKWVEKQPRTRIYELSEYEACIRERARKKAQWPGGIQPDYTDFHLAAELAMLITYLKLLGPGVMAGISAALNNPYTLVAIFGAVVVYMAFDLMGSDCEDLLEKSYRERRNVDPGATAPMDAIILMPK